MTHFTPKSGLGLVALGLLTLLAAPAARAQAPPAGSGPVSKLYLTAGDQGHNFIIQGSTVTQSNQAAASSAKGESAIAVSGDVRTLIPSSTGSTGGANYDLNFTDTGGRYTSTFNFFDGTTDGTHNYGVNFNFGSENVYQTGRNWQTSVALFQVPEAYFGITYDRTNNSLWISNFNGTTVSDYSLTGTLLSSFNTTFSSITCLALDPADNTLWMGSQNTKGTFYQYSKGGVFLQSDTYAALANQNTLGGEFNIAAPAVPEASTTVSLGLLLALGLGGMTIAARRKTRV